MRTYLRAIAPIGDPEPGTVVSTGFAVVTPGQELLSEFAAYALRAPYFVERVVANSMGVSFPAINESELSAFELAVPPPAEQRAIAAFLDRQTTRIDALVAKKERLIELLQEQRTALITRAVTKGLVPTVRMKDSGVEWLGQIPAHWMVKRVRDVAESLQTGPFGSQLHASDYVDGGAYPIINPANLSEGRLLPDVNSAVDHATAKRLAHHQVLRGDILFARRGQLGRCGLVTKREEGWLCGTGCVRLRVQEGAAIPSYLIRVFTTSVMRDWLALESVGATMENLNTSIVGRAPVTIPPIEEQRAIAAMIDCEADRIDALIARIRQAIERLMEFRLALHSAAVTGKIDVREEPA